MTTQTQPNHQPDALKRQRGYSLVELSIALAIVAIIVAGALAGVQSILRQNAVVNTVTHTNKAVGAIIAKFARDPSWAGVTTQGVTARGLGVFEPSDITNGGAAGATIRSPLGRVMVQPLAAAAHGVPANQGIVYSLVGVTEQACVDLVLSLEGLARAVSVVNQVPPENEPTALGANIVKSPNVAITAATVAGFCSPAADATGQTTISLLVPRV